MVYLLPLHGESKGKASYVLEGNINYTGAVISWLKDNLHMISSPGETEELFQETLDTLDELRFSAIHVFPYSKRQGTPAASFPDQVTESVKHERVRRVQEREALYSLEYRSRFIGKTVSVLAEEEKMVSMKAFPTPIYGSA